MLKKKKFLIGGIILILAMVYLGYTGVSSAAVYYYEVSEILAQGDTIYGEKVRVNGEVVPGSLQRKDTERLLNFTLVDTAGKESLTVVFHGIVPDTFKEGSPVVAEGLLRPNGVFQAETLMPKCPSKYVAES